MSVEQILAGMVPFGFGYGLKDEPYVKPRIPKKIKGIKNFSSEALNEQEESPEEETSTAEDDEAAQLGDSDDNNDDDEGEDAESDEQSEGGGKGLYRQEGGGNSGGRKKGLKRGAMVGGGMTAFLIVLIILLLLLAFLKAVHFSTILRTAGFAASQNIMRKAFSEVSYTDWVDENDTLKLPESKLLNKLLRNEDMRGIQRKLAEDGTFKYTQDANGNHDGFELRGERVSYDDIAKKMGAESWEELGYREKLTARKYLTDELKFKIGETYDIEARSFRNSFWKGFREVTGIRMTRFRDIFRDKFGKGTIDPAQNDDKARLGNENAEVMEKGGVGSENPDVEKASEEVAKDIGESSKQGIRKSAKQSLDNYLKTKGSSISDFEAGMSKVSTAVMVTSLYCMGHDLSHTSDRINQQIEQSLARFGHQQQTASDQIKSGDVTSGDVAFASKEWSGDKNTPDAAASPLYQQAIGNNPANQGLDDAPRMNISLPFLDWLKPVDNIIRTAASGGLNQLPVVGDKIDQVIDSATTKACGVVMNPYAQGGIVIADLAVSFVTLGTKDFILQSLKGVAMFAGFAGLGQIIESYIHDAAGAAVTGTEVGASKYNASAVSTDYLNSQTGRGTTYAAPETSDESSSTKGLAMAELRSHYQNSSVTDRYFAITNPQSLLGLAVANTPTSLHSVSSTLATLPSSIGTVFSQTFGTIGSMFGGSKVRAATNQDISRKNDYFGINQWGWTPDEQSVLQDSNIADNAAAVEQDMGRDSSYYEGLDKCYSSNRMLYELAKDDNCSAEKLHAPRALQWRIYKLHEFAVNQMSSEGINEN